MCHFFSKTFTTVTTVQIAFFLKLLGGSSPARMVVTLEKTLDLKGMDVWEHGVLLISENSL